jgi:hypothetical protein
MTEEIAKRSIDWLRDTGAGVLALMGGEPSDVHCVPAFARIVTGRKPARHRRRV